MIDLHARIAIRAYFAWETAGRPEGQREAHWLAAERTEIESNALAAHADHLAASVLAQAAKRSAAAKRGAATRKANREAVAMIATDAMAKPFRESRPVMH